MRGRFDSRARAFVGKGADLVATWQNNSGTKDNKTNLVENVVLMKINLRSCFKRTFISLHFPFLMTLESLLPRFWQEMASVCIRGPCLWE